MKNILTIALIFISIVNINAQSKEFTQYLSLPRLDTINWGADGAKILYYAPSNVNKCQICSTSKTDTLYNETCFNSVSGFAILDTNLRVTKENIIGNWEIIEGGIFEVRDSLFDDNLNFERTFQIIDYTKGNGNLFITDKTIRIETLEDEKLIKNQKKYSLVNNQYISMKGLLGQACGFRNIGITNDGLLIIDSNTYIHLIKWDKYMVYKTIINRTIFKKK